MNYLDWMVVRDMATYALAFKVAMVEDQVERLEGLLERIDQFPLNTKGLHEKFNQLASDFIAAKDAALADEGSERQLSDLMNQLEAFNARATALAEEISATVQEFVTHISQSIPSQPEEPNGT